jgi:hypothetical protein
MAVATDDRSLMRRSSPRSTSHRHSAPTPITSFTAAAAGTLTLLFAVGLTFAFTGSAQAAAVSVPLGTAGSFAVLAGSTVTNTGPSVIDGNVGLSPGTAVSGFPPGIVNGTTHAADAVAAQAKADLKTAYNVAAAEKPPIPVVGDLGGQTLDRGVYNSATTLGLTGEVTLDAQGDPDAVWVFQAGSTLITASSSKVTLINGASPCNVFWQVGSSATLGTASTFRGSILALTSITVTTGTTIHGRVLARSGAVTLDTDTITRPRCASTPPTSSAPTSSAPTRSPTKSPTGGPSHSPSGGPTSTGPSTGPTGGSSGGPSNGPSGGPSNGPTNGATGTGVPQVSHVPKGPAQTGDGGSVRGSHPIVAITGVLALLTSLAAFVLWRREVSRS